MTKVKLNIATWDYDRVAPIIDGRVPVEGCEVSYAPMTPAEVFRRTVKAGEFEVAEVGFGSYTIGLSRGISHYVAIPVFLSRMFRHSCIYIRTDHGIAGPGDLNGKTIGVIEYQNAASLWARGLLMDEYGFKPETCAWRQGGLNQSGHPEKLPMNLPDGFRLKPLGHGETLNTLFFNGEIDAVISPFVPAAFGDSVSPVRRLFEDFKTDEKKYFEKTGIYPVMHALGIRRDVLEAHPWIAASLYKAYSEAKRISQIELAQTNAYKIGLPWLADNVAEARQTFGQDFWPYGIEANRKALEALVRYSFEQGQSVSRLTVEDLFAAGADA